MDSQLLSSLVRAISHTSDEVKCTSALGVQHIASKDLSLSEMKVSRCPSHFIQAVTCLQITL